jgi:hypothetical protein
MMRGVRRIGARGRFISAVTFVGTVFVIAVTLSVAVPERFEPMQRAWEVAIFIAMLTIPATVGFAITRYRLYDIEVVINRAIVYGPLTAVVAASYVGAVQLARVTFVAATGDRSDSELLVGTLIAAAVFWMARARLIGWVDRNFKDPREPAKDLRKLEADIRQMSQIIEPSVVSAEPLAEYVLRNCVTAFDADGGRMAFVRGHGPVSPVSVGAPTASPATTTDVVYAGVAMATLELGARRLGRAYAPRDVDALQSAPATFAEILARKAPQPRSA